jgi:LPS O-antigen subunit length determinant protein (WzzB/FepE family)
MSQESPDIPKRNWLLILAGIIGGLLVAATAAGLIAMYVGNFNPLDWME